MTSDVRVVPALAPLTEIPVGHHLQAADTVVVIEATGGWRALDLGEMWRFRDLFRAFAIRDIKLRYRQTLLGAVWVVLQPLITAAILTYVFSRIASLKTGIVPFFLVALTGMVAWTFFSGLVTRGSAALTGNAALVGKVFFPRALLPLSALGSGFVDLLIGLGITLTLAAVEGFEPGLRLLMAPIWLLLLLLLAIGPVLLLSAAMVSYRDVGLILPVLVQLGLYASPIAYPLSSIPDSGRPIFELNPLVAPIEGLRKAILGYGLVPGQAVISSITIAAVLLAAGTLYFRRFEQRFADVI